MLLTGSSLRTSLKNYVGEEFAPKSRRNPLPSRIVLLRARKDQKVRRIFTDETTLRSAYLRARTINEVAYFFLHLRRKFL